MPDTYPYSMTDYWTMLQRDMLTLKETDDSFYSIYIPLNTALDMVSEGLKFEKYETGATSLQGIMDKIVELSQGIGPKATLSCTIKRERKTHQYHLPEIKDTNTLLFAILYHKHLRLFQQHTYKGAFGDSWPLYIKSKIDAKTNSKRPWSEAQASYLKTNILAYVTEHKLALTEADLLPQANTSPSDFIAQLKPKILVPPVAVTEVDEEAPDTHSELERLIQATTDKKSLFEDAQKALNSFQSQKVVYEQASQAYKTALREFNQKTSKLGQWFVSKTIKSRLTELQSEADEKKRALSLNQGETIITKTQGLMSTLKSAKTEYDLAKLAVTQEEKRLAEEERQAQEARRLAEEQAEQTSRLQDRSQAHNVPAAQHRPPPQLPPPNPAQIATSFFHSLPNRQCIKATLAGTAITAATTAMLYYSM